MWNKKLIPTGCAWHHMLLKYYLKIVCTYMHLQLAKRQQSNLICFKVVFVETTMMVHLAQSTWCLPLWSMYLQTKLFVPLPETSNGEPNAKQSLELQITQPAQRHSVNLSMQEQEKPSKSFSYFVEPPMLQFTTVGIPVLRCAMSNSAVGSSANCFECNCNSTVLNVVLWCEVYPNYRTLYLTTVN